MGLAHNITQPLSGPGPLDKDVSKPYLASTASSLWYLWVLVSRQVGGQPGLAGELRAVMLEILVREKLGVVIT